MSSSRVLYICSLVAVFTLNSCEDKNSKKKNSQINKNSSVSNSAQTDSSSIEKINKNHSIKEEEAEPFKITNDNLRAFMTKYGQENPETQVRIKTMYGNIDIQLYTSTPLHRANFIYMVKQKYFDETFFYRVAKGFVIQGGNSDRNQMAKKRHEIGEYTIPQEQVPGLKHIRGSVALSKQWVDNPSNRSTPFEFFIVIAKKGAHHLNGEHTIFGKVIKGMSVADKISNVPVDGSEWPLDNIFIKAEVLK